ncbi:GSTU19 [Symbiodinium natans]|uniref:GSTU19 protein n=1 Tax=Symbiodinium natans TaxID=878477 RepID=A0A812SGC9_9DINO|nr:GSTU19 [Symbiodinium natans]
MAKKLATAKRPKLGSVVKVTKGRKAFHLQLPPRFSLGATVCSYGFAMLAPNRWQPPQAKGSGAHRKGVFLRPLQLARGGAARAALRQISARVLEVSMSKKLSSADVGVLQQQVVRMLRLGHADKAAADAFTRSSPDLAKAPVGRLFRSPTVFEDLVKTFTLCNCGWTRTIAMNEKLCQHFGGPARGFPSPADLVKVPAARLKKLCAVGYRAERIIKLARFAQAGGLDGLSHDRLDEQEAGQRCKAIYGLGPFGVANALQLLGFYKDIPADSETCRHLRQARGLRSCTLQNVSLIASRVYRPYAPHQFLRYWTELWRTYEQRMGSEAWAAEPSKYRLLTAAHMHVPRQKYKTLKKTKKELHRLYPDFVACSPRGLLPALDNGGEHVYDSIVLLEYVHETFSGPPLLPTSPFARAKVRLWSKHVDLHIVPNYERLLAAHDAEARAMAREDLLQSLALFEAAMAPLAKGPFFLGDDFSMADVVLAPWWQRMCSVLRAYRKFDPSAFSRLQVWFEAVEGRPCFARTALDPEKLIEEFSFCADPDVEEGVRFRRGGPKFGRSRGLIESGSRGQRHSLGTMSQTSSQL